MVSFSLRFSRPFVPIRHSVATNCDIYHIFAFVPSILHYLKQTVKFLYVQ
jgi:hypothetical protein